MTVASHCAPSSALIYINNTVAVWRVTSGDIILKLFIQVGEGLDAV